MELVYLWVEAYKNIHNQGFNFSPRFHCDFKAVYKKDEDGKKVLDEENSELIICDKRKKECKDNDYIENFFGDNINVTAIVGKNGSGKSSVFELIYNIIESKSSIKEKYILVFLQSNTIKYVANIKFNSDINYDNNIFNNPILFYKSDKSFFNYRDSYISSSYNKKVINLNEKSIYDILKKSLNMKSVFENLNIDDKIYMPIKVKVELKSDKELLLVISDFLPQEDIENVKQNFPHLNQYQKLKLLDIILHNYNVNLGDLFNLLKNYPNNEDEFKKYERELLNTTQINKFISHLTTSKLYNISELTEEQKRIYFNTNDIFQHNKIFILFKINFFDKHNKSFASLSYGEKILLALKLYIFNNLGIGDKTTTMCENDFLFFFDEIETSLHPTWQKNIIKEILYLVGKYKIGNENVSLIFATHSPFLLSDIPKQNIIFLDTDEEGKCKVVNGPKEKKQTFGANIHTLLSDSFFMEEGLMGEFAKGKIDKAITLLNQEHLSDEESKYCEQIISITGEPIVKNQLQRMLDSKRLKKIDEIDAIKSSMEAMQKRLDELEK